MQQSVSDEIKAGLVDLEETQVTIVGGDEKRTDYIMKIKGEEVEVSRQIFDDVFNYDEYKCAQPPYNFSALLYFFNNNTWHSRCCRLKAACTVGLGYDFQTRKGGINELKEREQLEDFFAELNTKDTFQEIMGRVMIDYESIGMGYLEVVRNFSGKISKVYHVPAYTMRMRADRDGFVQCRDTRYIFFKNYGDKTVYDIRGEVNPAALPNERATEIIQFSQYCPDSDFYGVPEWLPSMGAMLGSEKSSDFNIQFFENNAVPQFAVIVRKAKLGADTTKVIAEYFRKHIKGKNHKTLVLEVPGEGELELQELGKENKDSSFRLYRLDNRDEVIAAHGVPPRMIGIISAGSLGGKGDAEGQKESFLTQIIAPRQESLNYRFNRFIKENGLPTKNYRFEFERLNAADDKVDSEIYECYIKVGVFSINDVRDKLGEEILDVTKYPGASEYFLFTSSGPILISKLTEYMDAALIPTQPKPPGLAGSDGESIKDSTKTRAGNKVTKLIEDIVTLQKELRDEQQRRVPEED